MIQTMTSLEFLKQHIPGLSETDSLYWCNPDYAKAVLRRVTDICAEMEQFAADVTFLVRGSVSSAVYSDDYIRENSFNTCFKHVVQIKQA